MFEHQNSTPNNFLSVGKNRSKNSMMIESYFRNKLAETELFEKLFEKSIRHFFTPT